MRRPVNPIYLRPLTKGAKTMTSIQYDESYWPGTGTTIDKLPTDLLDLWDTFPDQAETFVAKALIDASTAGIVLHFSSGEPTITDYLWQVGGDTLVREENLVDLLNDINPDTHPTDLSNQIAGLEKLEVAIIKAKRRIMRGKTP
jgi:hypothetical protein